MATDLSIVHHIDLQDEAAAHSSLIRLDSNRTLQIGGEKADFSSSNKLTLWTAEHHDANNGQIQFTAHPVDTVGSQPLPVLDGHASCLIGQGSVLITGGWHPGHDMRLIELTLEASNVSTMSASVSFIEPAEGNQSPAPRVRHTAIHDSANRQVIVFGGRLIGSASDDPVLSAEVFAFDLKHNMWRRLYAPDGAEHTTGVPEPRCGHSCVMDDKHGRMFIFGGMSAAQDGKNRYLDDLFSFDTKSHIWTRIEIENGPVPAPRERHAAVMWQGDKLLIIGGWTKGQCVLGDQTLMLFDPDRKTWQSVTASGLSSTALSRFGHAAVALGQGHEVLLIIGGRGNGFSIQEDGFALHQEGATLAVEHTDKSEENTIEQEDPEISEQKPEIDEHHKESSPSIDQPENVIVESTTSEKVSLTQRLGNRTRKTLLDMERRVTIKRPRRQTTAVSKNVKGLLEKVANINELEVPDYDSAINEVGSVTTTTATADISGGDSKTKKKPLGGVSIFGAGGMGMNLNDVLAARKKLGKKGDTSAAGAPKVNSDEIQETGSALERQEEEEEEQVPVKKKKPVGGVPMFGAMPNMQDILNVKLKKTNK